jgi:hypothetical protein
MEISIRTVDNNQSIIFEYFEANEVKLSKYLIGKEVGKKNKNEHFHYHLVVTKCKIKEDSLRTAIRRLLYNYYKCKNYYVKTVNDTEKHELYVTKDGNYVHSGYTEKEIEELDRKNGEINYDKSLPVYQKVYNRLVAKYDGNESLGSNAMDKRWCISQILTIFKEWDACPPSKTDMFRYINFIQIKECDLDVAIENYI